MSLRINHNLAALNGNRNLKLTTDFAVEIDAEAVVRFPH